MAVGIIQGLQNLIEYTDYTTAARSAQYFSSYSTAYDAMLENGYKMGSDAVVRGVIDGAKANGKIVEFQPRTTGGTQAGIDVPNVTENATTGEITVMSGGATMTAVPLIELLGGIFAGLGVGILSYELNKDFWIDISNNLFLNVPGYEPITYDNIEDMSILTLFSDGKTYVDAELVQQVNNYLIQIGAFSAGTTITYDIPPTTGLYDMTSVDVTKDNIRATIAKALNYGNGATEWNIYTKKLFAMIIEPLLDAIPIGQFGYATNYAIDMGCYTQPSSDTDAKPANIRICFFDDTMPAELRVDQVVSDDYARIVQKYTRYNITGSVYTAPNNPVTPTISAGSSQLYLNRYIGLYGDGHSVWTSSINSSIVIIPAIPELPLLPNATQSTTPDSIPTEMPDWWADMLELGAIDPAVGAVVGTQYLPVSVPNTSPVTNPVTTPQADIQTGRVPSTNPTPVGDSVLPLMTPTDSPFRVPNDPKPTPTPTPAIPIIPAIGGQANKLFTVYNPSQANLDALGSTLWTQNIITQIVQMFTNNPMDAVISLHILYATPTTGANKEIKLGYVPTGVSCPEVTNQYVNVNCGTVRVPELFGDARDYANTDISIYLPMIGFRQLKTEDAMASYINVDYKVDVFTGTVLANITITRDSTNQVFYTFEGNCAVNLPLTGADKSRQIASAVGVIGAVAMKNPFMGVASVAGIAGGGGKAGITRSGNFTGNAGAMGCKKPYIIVSSDVPYDAAGYQAQYGYPANITVMLGDCSGYVKVKEVHADTISNATEQEKRDIENQLKQGIIIH